MLTLLILICGLLMLFAGYPVLSHFLKKSESSDGSYGLGGTNGTGQIPKVIPSLLLKDSDTPTSAQTWQNKETQESYHLVFSDEFETEGRTFWPGDDPFWQANDIWYGATGNLEWLTPEQINTTNGHLQITLTDKPMHNLNFRSGMLSSWNKFCFQGGYLEMSAILPGSQAEQGWWPGLWTLGNLARPGYLGTTDGMWPYSYKGCDSGILANQTAVGRTGYESIVTSKKYGKTGLSWLPGMRTPSCTCSGQDHPGPNNNVARSAPEIDILEAQVSSGQGGASQSLQVAPFDLGYDWNQTIATVYDDTITTINSYTGGVYQEAISGVTNIPTRGYSNSANSYVTYGVDYSPDWNGDGSGYITWYMDGQPVWKVTGQSVSANANIDIGQRIIPTEPMSIIMNLGISEGFQTINFDTLTYPAVMKVDYVRLYQPNSYKQDLVSCNPADHPTSDYIQKHIDVYDNANITEWPNKKPTNKLTGC
jgi:beta-glucanase (GH16 family)